MNFTSETEIIQIRKEFPLLLTKVYGKDLVYLDNAATTQKPQIVLDAIENYYRNLNSNIHRGAHYLANKATFEYEETRETVASFLNAGEKEEIIFTGGTTDSINLVAATYARKFLQEGDEILLSELEHHSNIVPWQLIAAERGCIIKVLPILDSGEWDMAVLNQFLTSKTKMVAISHVSNSLGTINPIKAVIQKAHAVGAVVLIDGAQAVSHLKVDVADLDCDFYAFSGHKLYAPMGVGVLYGKRALLEKMPPYRGGGEMIKTVSFKGTTFNDIPFKFEAGTPHVEGVIGLGVAIKFLNELNLENIAMHENMLLSTATAGLEEIEGLKIYGPDINKTSVISFNVEGIHPYDIGTLLDKQGIAVRTGHHCTQPLMDRLGIPGTIRISCAVYNTVEEIEVFLIALRKAINLLTK